MFKFKGISSNDMQVVIEEEEHFIARAARRYEVTEIEGRDGAIFNELGYSYVERPIYVQCLNTNKIDDILAWLDGEGEFEYKGRKTTARFYSQLEPQRETVIRIIDTTFIRDPFWTKLEDESVEVKGDKEKNAEGENINIKGTIPVKFKEFKVSGNSKQETRSGKNLLKNNLTDTTINGVTFKINEDKSITVNGTATANIIANLVSGQYNDNNADEPLTIPDNVTNLRLSGCPTGGSSSTYKLDLYNSDYILLATDFGNGTSVIIPEENKNISRARIIIYSGATVNNLTFKPMLEKGTTATDYEPYGAMPSPEYPSEIQNVEGDVNVTVANKNIANSNWAERFVEVVNDNSKARIEDVDGRRCLYFSANAGSGNDEAYFFKGIFKENTSYIIEYDIKPTTTNSNISCYYKDGTLHRNMSNSGTRLMANAWNKSRNITATNKTIDYIRNDWFDGACYIDLDTVQIIEEGTTTSDYVKNEQQTVTFPLSQGQKLMLGDYLADYGIHHVREQVELDGTETWTTIDSQNTDNTFYLATLAVDETISQEIDTVLSNIATQGLVWGSDEGNLVQNTKMYASLRFRFWKEDFSSVEGWKSYLAQQKQAGTPVIVEYVLAEEEIEAYTPEQQEAYNQLKQLTAYEEETNVYSTNEVSPIFKVTYIEETTEKIENEGNIYSRPILRLEKTSYNNVDIEIAGTRFQYNFNDEEYVEIDCEEKTALYEGLNRNRKLEIGYEFPKLLPGENDIKMHEGDCIIKAKRKDRWL